MIKTKQDPKRHWQKSYDAGVPAEIDPETYSSVGALFSQAMETYSDLAVLECFGQTTSFARLNTLSRDFAAFLQKNIGVTKGDRVALMAPNVPAFVIAMTGIMRAGAVQVNVTPLYTPRELQHQLQDAQAEIIVVFSGVTSALAEIIDTTLIQHVIVLDLGDGTGLPIPSPAANKLLKNTVTMAEALRLGADLDLDEVNIRSDDNLFFQYTGGTTGPSKGAVLSHRNILANAAQFKAVLPQASDEGAEIMVCALPLYHIFGLMMMIAYVSIGGKIILIPNPRDMDGMIDAIKGSHFTVIPGVNTLYAGMAMHPRIAEVDFSALKIAVGGGAAVIKTTSQTWKKLTGKHIKEGYGLSETSPLLCINPASVDGFSGTCGLPVPSTDVKLLDENDVEVDIGERGEICCAGPQVMSGYWNKPDANASAFTDDGYFRTGDIGVFDNAGFLQIVDRKKDMIIVSGFNVFPNEIEAVVTSCEGVVECACVGMDDENSGEAIKVFAVKAENTDLDAATVVAHCRENLAGYKIPKHVIFLPELPKSNVGKILRRELRKL